MKTFDIYSTLKNDLSIDEDNKTITVIPQLAAKDYSKLKTLLGRLGGKWVSSKGLFQLKKSPSALIERVLNVGSRCLNKFHFYPTPESIFAAIVNFSDLSFLGESGRTIRVLEPSCGDGGLIDMLLAYATQNSRTFDVTGYEIDPLNVIACQESGLNVYEADFLKVTPDPSFELVLANPPFAGESFIKHIRHAQKFLTLDGVMIVVVPTAWIKANNKSEDRRWLLEQAHAGGDSLLDSGEFFPAGTFDGVGIETTFITLRSAAKAEAILASNDFKERHLIGFDMFFASSSECYSWAAEIRSKIESVDVLAEAKERVEQILNSNDNDTIYLPRRFINDYAADVVNIYFPEAKATIVPKAFQLGAGEEVEAVAAPTFALTLCEIPPETEQNAPTKAESMTKPKRRQLPKLDGQLDLIEFISSAA